MTEIEVGNDPPPLKFDLCPYANFFQKRNICFCNLKHNSVLLLTHRLRESQSDKDFCQR